MMRGCPVSVCGDQGGKPNATSIALQLQLRMWEMFSDAQDVTSRAALSAAPSLKGTPSRHRNFKKDSGQCLVRKAANKAAL